MAVFSSLAGVFGLVMMASSAPPSDARPLSLILGEIEKYEGFSHFEDIEWDDDGYWEIEYKTQDRHERKVKVDPVSGKPR